MGKNTLTTCLVFLFFSGAFSSVSQSIDSRHYSNLIINFLPAKLLLPEYFKLLLSF
ncbi:hypothetical protein GOY14_01615 [Wolbachia endosymbiont of Dipetalonema caudispina]|uniref:hypothetical protein n=1 Tax=Wolbachia endosymbiont of Dipetalonema caudispina TaxID=1812112 RepID=UPI00158E1978|nr:hypothetical protein [Wolbachia endosymbiont of Dipetalonema caudispina]QKX01035.1 hypothetical protein GOY14_01615 [Wolbachia endosymbiont of Dipetalonema caudispina]